MGLVVATIAVFIFFVVVMLIFRAFFISRNDPRPQPEYDLEQAYAEIEQARKEAITAWKQAEAACKSAKTWYDAGVQAQRIANPDNAFDRLLREQDFRNKIMAESLFERNNT